MFPEPSTFKGPAAASVRGCVDLHMHSNFSDGERPPEYLVRWAAQLGLKAIALTDHDTTRGVKQAMALGRDLGVEVVPGCEISVKLSNGTFHLLAYCFDPDDEAFDARLREIAANRESRNRKILQALTGMGMPIAYEELAAEAGEAVIGRPHIAALMVHKGFVQTRQEAFDKYIDNDGPAYFEKDTFGPAEALAFVRKHNAVPVLAHPYWLNRGSLEATETYLREMKGYGLLGIEVIYPDHDQAWTRGLTDIAGRLDLIITGGSDYHGGRTKPHTTLGHGEGGGFCVPAEVLAGLKKAAGLS